MPRVHVLVAVSGTEHNWAPGDIVDMTDEQAAAWCDGERAELAELVDEQTPADPAGDDPDALVIPGPLVAALRELDEAITDNDRAAADAVVTRIQEQGLEEAANTLAELIIAWAVATGPDLDDEEDEVSDEDGGRARPGGDVETTEARPAEETTGRPRRSRKGRANGSTSTSS